MSYKNDHALTIANKYGAASSAAKAELYETYDRLRDLTISGSTATGSGFGTAALGWILAAGSFNSNPTGEASIAAIKVAVIWVPIVVVVIGLVCLYLFDLDQKYDKIVEDIENGKWKDGEF